MIDFGLVVLGAHTGEFLLNDIKNFSDKSCLLIEPVPYNFNKLKLNTSSFNHVMCCDKAISDVNEINKFYYVKEKSISKLGKHWASEIGSFKKKHILEHKYKRFKIEENDIEVRDVEFITFDDLIKKYLIKSIDKLQIDVEGSEYKIMKSIDFNKVKIEKVFFECKHFDDTFTEGVKLEEIKNILSSNGYTLKRVDKENMVAEK